MSSFTFEEMKELHGMGYDAMFIEDAADGDELAIKSWGREGEPAIKFVRVIEMKKMAQGNGHYLMRFIGLYEDGMTEPMTYGSSWPVFRKVDKLDA